MNHSAKKPDSETMLRVLESEQILISVDQLARLLDVSPRTVWRLRKDKQIVESLRVGGSVRWRLDDVKQWVADGCPAVTSGESNKPRKRKET